jgi:hypothetical protein
MFGINKGSEDGCIDSIKDDSWLGVKLGINRRSEEGFEDGCWDGIKDGP